jgi:hypothetical protein
MVKKYFNFTNDIKQNIIKFINPTTELQNNINDIINFHNLTVNNFNIIHIRGGDDIININDSKMNNLYQDKKYFLISAIKYIKKHYIPNKTYLISDSIYIKRIISNIFKDIKYDNNESVHLSLSNSTNNDLIKYTMQDLYLLLYCKQVISITIYSHGSGFIKWLSTLHNKHFIQYILNGDNAKLKFMLQ